MGESSKDPFSATGEDMERAPVINAAKKYDAVQHRMDPGAAKQP